MKTKDKLAPLLRAYKNGDVDFDYAMDFLLREVSSRRESAFLIGLLIGVVMMLAALIMTTC